MKSGILFFSLLCGIAVAETRGELEDLSEVRLLNGERIFAEDIEGFRFFEGGIDALDTADGTVDASEVELFIFSKEGVLLMVRPPAGSGTGGLYDPSTESDLARDGGSGTGGGRGGVLWARKNGAVPEYPAGSGTGGSSGG